MKFVLSMKDCKNLHKDIENNLKLLEIYMLSKETLMKRKQESKRN